MHIKKYKLFLVIFLPILLFSFKLGSIPYSHSEARYVEIPRGMLERNDFVTPRINGIKYFEKPPFMYWVGSLSYKFFGANEWAHRFWPALFGVLVVFATYYLGTVLKSQQAGFIASMMLTTSLLFYACSKVLLLDIAVSSFITFALYSFLLSINETISKQKKFVFNMSFFVFLALGCLSKGFIAIVLPYGIIFLWILFTRNFRYLKEVFHPFGILLFCLIALPWHILASIRNPEFFHFYFIHEHIERFLTTTHNRHEPVYYFFLVLLIGLFPWFFIILELVCENFKKILKNEVEFFFLLWFLLVFLFFSLSQSKMIPYILPVIPPLFLLGGFKLSDNNFKLKSMIPGYLNVLFCLLLIISLPFVTQQDPVSKKIFAYIIPVQILLSCMIYLTLVNKKKVPFIFYVFFSSSILFIINSSLAFIDTGSIKSFVQIISKEKKPNDVIISYENYYQDLPVYMNARVYVVGERDELAFGMQQEDTSAWMIEKEQFDKWVQQFQSGYIILNRKSLKDFKWNLFHKITKVSQTTDQFLYKFEN